MLKRILIGLAVVLVIGLVGFELPAYRLGIAPIQANSGPAFSPEIIAKGEILAAMP
jgi:hypothetical protein